MIMFIKDSLLPSSMSGNSSVEEPDTLSVHEATDEVIETDLDVTGTSLTDVLFPSTFTSNLSENINFKGTTKMKRKKKITEADDTRRLLQLEEKNCHPTTSTRNRN